MASQCRGHASATWNISDSAMLTCFPRFLLPDVPRLARLVVLPALLFAFLLLLLRKNDIAMCGHASNGYQPHSRPLPSPLAAARTPNADCEGFGETDEVAVSSARDTQTTLVHLAV